MNELELATQDKPSSANEAARAVAETHGSLILSIVAHRTFAGLIPEGGYLALCNQIIEGLGGASDALERMMIEQLIWSHFAVGDLFLQAEKSNDAETTEMFIAAAAKLSGEFRRSLAALRAYRSPQPTQQITLMQQNIAAGGDQKVALIEGAHEDPSRAKKLLNIELVSPLDTLGNAKETLAASSEDRRTTALV